MKSLSTDELRVAYLDFFKGHGHAEIPGAPLIPENDPTVLFTTAGMHPLVPYLLGESHPAGKRLTSCQKCVRTQDIDEVGDSSHLTFFEMLGNWSLGDYFKEEAIQLSLEFLTEVLEIPLDSLAITCFAGDKDAPKDDESARLWKKIGIPEARIGFLPKKDNWWGPAGHTGPCGPDTEMFVWIRDAAPQGNPATHPDGWLEIWNDVFMEYNKKEDGSFEPLKQKNVDTGMGLERVAQVLQGVSDVYETDQMKPIMKKIHTLCHAEEPRVSPFETSPASQLPPQDDTRGVSKHVRIIVDHLKAATFIIADGVQPSNVDRGYVLRRLIRRAIRSGFRLEIKNEQSLCTNIAEEIIAQYAGTYSQLRTHATLIKETLSREQHQFAHTLEEGMRHLQRVQEKMVGDTMDGITAFHLYDTYGFPFELTKEICQEAGLKIDEAGFKKSFEEHQQKSRAGAEKKFAGGLADHSAETTKLHTVTHLLNAALRKVLGNHIEQKGSNITQERLRFDFNHPDKLTPEQLAQVEKLVNEAIQKDYPVSYHLTTVDAAKKEGAIGVFDERYGNEVKVYVIGKTASCHGEPVEPFSKEICGGPHVARTGMIGAFKITKEESSSAGIRRIKAIVTGGPASIQVASEEEMSS